MIREAIQCCNRLLIGAGVLIFSTGAIRVIGAEGEALPFVWEMGYSSMTDEIEARYPGVYKLGGWWHTGWFEDQYYDDQGLSLADPFSSQVPRPLKKNWGLFAVAEQKIWRPANATEERGLSVFARAGYVPSDRNPVAFSTEGGFHYVGLLPGRPHDLTGLGRAYSPISERVRSLARDNNLYTIPPVALPDYEAAIEFTHRMEIKPWWHIQPGLQFILHPGGSQDIPNALVLGLRSTLSF
jgi:porin